MRAVRAILRVIAMRYAPQLIVSVAHWCCDDPHMQVWWMARKFLDGMRTGRKSAIGASWTVTLLAPNLGLSR